MRMTSLRALGRSSRRAAAVTLTTSALAGACNLNDEYYPSPGFGGGGGSFLDAGSRSEPSHACDDPQEGTSCSAIGSRYATCETKLHANQACNARLHCDHAWSAEPARKQDCPTDCPSTYVADLPDGCSAPNADALICEYPEGTCGCAPVRPDRPSSPDGGADGGEDVEDAGEVDGGGDAGSTVYEWKCVTAEPGCPRTRPRAGAPCTRRIDCDYGSCVFEDGVVMTCTGEWSIRTPACNR